MKKIILCLGLMAFVTLSSCEKKTEKTVETETTTVVQDTVVKEVPQEDTTDDGTSVKVDSSGVQIKSKKTDVEIKK